MCSWCGVNRKIWVLLLVVIGVVTALSACGGGESGTTVSTATKESVAVATPTAKAPEATAVVDDKAAFTAHLDAAEDYFAAGDYGKAITELEQAVALEPDNADAYTNLALSYFENGDYAKAADAWSEVIRLKPGDGDAYYERGISRFNLKQYEDAIADLTVAIDADSTRANAFRVRGKAYAFSEDCETAIDDFTQAIALDPASDEAYYNRAMCRAEIGGMADLSAVIADLGMVMQVSENPDLRAQTQQALENVLASTDDPVLQQQASDALEGKVTPASGSEIDPMWAAVDPTRAPGHSIGFQRHLDAGAAHRFLFLGSQGDTVGAGIASSAAMMVGIQDTQTGLVLGAVPSNDNSLLINIPQNSLYHIVIEDTGGQGGDYAAAFEASSKVSFALDPNYFIVGRLPQGGLLYYTFTAPGGAMLQGNAVPHPDTPVDLVVKVLELESQALQTEYNATGSGQNEQFAFTVPDSGDGRLLTYIVSIEDVDGKAGTYVLAVASDALASEGSETSPEAIVQIVLDAAASGNLAPLETLCDPQGENDGDTQMICDVARDATNREEFVSFFGTGKVAGEARLSPQGDLAEVPMLVGPDGDEEETMTLIKRDGRWYLYEF